MGAVTVFRVSGTHQGKPPWNKDEENPVRGWPEFTEEKIGIQSWCLLKQEEPC
jgi:hypothetical protein